MQQNQNNLKSIYTDAKLREEVALKICDELNKYIKANNPDYKPEELYSKKEIKEWVNNPQVMQRHMDSFNGNLIIDKLREKDKQYKEVEEYKQNVDENGNYYLNPNYNGDGSSNRNSPLFTDLDDSAEAEYNNQLNKNYSKNHETGKTFIYKILDKFEKCDLKELLPTSVEEVINQSDETYITSELGWAIKDQLLLHENDKVLYDNIQANLGFFQRSEKKSFNGYFNSFLSTLIPLKNDSNLALISSINTNSFVSFLDENFKDIKEFKEAPEKYIPKGTDIPGPYGFAKLCSNSLSLYSILEENKIYREMIDKGYLTKGFGSKYCYKDASGNIPSFETIVKAYKKGELGEKYTRTEFLPEEIEDRKKGAFAKAKALEIYFIYQQNKNGNLPAGLASLIQPVNDFAHEYEKYLIENKDVTDPLQQARNISAFMEANQNLVKNYEDMQKEVIRRKQEIIELEKAELNQTLAGLSDGNKTLNYQQLSDKALTETKNMRETNMDEILKSHPNNNIQKLFNSGYAKDDFVKTEKNELTAYANKDDIVKSIGLISDINKADNQYKKRFIFARLWYKKSHNAMMQTRDTLINSLSNRGIDKASLEKIGKDNNFDVAKFTRTTVNLITFKQDKYNKEINDFYDKKIGQPTREIEELKNDLNVNKEIYDGYKEQVKKSYNSCFEKFVENTKSTYGNILAGKTPDNLGDLADKEIILQQFDEWIKNNESEYMAIFAYNKSVENLENFNKENYYEDLEAEVNVRQKCLDKGEKFDKEQFDRDRAEAKKNNIPLMDRLEKDFKPEVEKGGQRLENNKDKNLEKKLGE